jgi:hypothetical protein
MVETGPTASGSDPEKRLSNTRPQSAAWAINPTVLTP